MSPGITGWMRLLCASALLVAGCTGRLPGTGAPARSRPGVVYETVRVPPPRPEPEPAPAPEPAVADAEYAAPPTGQSAYAEVPSYPSEPAAVAAPAPSVSAPVAMASAGDGARDQQLAILTEAVSALRAEISRSYTYSQELVEETKKLRSQLRSMRIELEKSRGENDKLRAQVRTLERQLKEIQIAAPVQGHPAPPAAAAPAAPAAPAPPPADAIPEPPVVDDRGVPADQDPELLEEEENTPPSP